ncbi:hypothetical protein [Marichromatium bheemlicum]|uniref:DUF4007 domain-containing protein n=1 Tax=Marichromatium bheemlicum TaxID=365339 RepID=A0ABX1IB98_9GAMM|nr:hypothetical protein [Marichromatium bheemlicum]NKN33465.1 hypothetical protein [Marichromatium bheemlicum]
MTDAAAMACEPLRLNFPQDFLPDRALLARLLDFAAKGGVGDKLAISDATGIPTGKSTGKVEPMIHYARGMGLVTGESERGIWRLRATGLGERVVSEDPFLGEAVTQWVCHLLLCRRSGPEEPARGLADAWFLLFAEGAARLGSRFSRDAFERALRDRHGEASYLRALSGLVPRAYLEPGCFGELEVLRRVGSGSDELYERIPASAGRPLFPAFTVALFLAWERLFPAQQQVPLQGLLDGSRLLGVLHWRRRDAEPWISWMCDRRLIRLDQLTGDTVAQRLVPTQAVVQGLYDELV